MNNKGKKLGKLGIRQHFYCNEHVIYNFLNKIKVNLIIISILTK